MAALAALQEHDAGVLLVQRRDRLARDVALDVAATRLVEHEGAQVHAVEGGSNEATPEGGLMRNIAAAFAQYERALISTRTKAATAVKRERNECVGGVTYGTRVARDGVHLELDPGEQRIIGRILALRECGLVVRAIIDKLNKDKVPARGARWYYPIVYKILRRALGGAPGRPRVPAYVIERGLKLIDAGKPLAQAAKAAGCSAAKLRQARAARRAGGVAP
jgi:hypothetical protein